MKQEIELRSRAIPQEISAQFYTRKLMCKKCHFLGYELFNDLCLNCKKELDGKKIAVVDIETTGFMKDGGLILEIGIVELDLENGNSKIIYNELVREEEFGQKHEDSWIFKNSDLTYKEMSDAQPIEMETIQSIFNRYRATAYNKKFDFDFLRSRGFIINELYCPMLFATKICKIPGYCGSWKWPKVQEAWDFLFGKTDYIEEHRGADDALHEAQIIYKLYKEHGFDLGLSNPEVNEV